MILGILEQSVTFTTVGRGVDTFLNCILNYPHWENRYKPTSRGHTNVGDEDF
jgi:hypothetical protein